MFLRSGNEHYECLRPGIFIGQRQVDVDRVTVGRHRVKPLASTAAKL
jgi:hypothetical protein